MATIVNNAIADSMFAGISGEATLTRRPLTPEEARAVIGSGVVTAFNPAHAATARAVARRTGVVIPVAERPARVALAPGDRLLVVTIIGALPRETREFTEAEIAQVEFCFSLWTVVGSTPLSGPQEDV